MATAVRQGRIGFFFHMGHGHYTQFLNFQECCPPASVGRTEWIPLRGDESGSLLGRLALVPRPIRYRLNQSWHAGRGVARRDDWQALFFAAEMAALIPLMRKHPSYLYTDLTPSLKRELAPWYDHQLRGSRAVVRVRERLRRGLFRTCRGVFTMSRWAARGVQCDYGVPPDRLHVVLPGANLNRWSYVDRSRRSAGEPVRILMVGGEFRLKGGPELLEWAEGTSAVGWEMDLVTWPGSLPHWVRDCLGQPADDAQVVADLGPRLPSVRVHCGVKPNTPQILDLFERADILCLPTHADGSSIASLEAMATGLPVLVGAVGGIPELVHDEETGFLLRRERPCELADKLEALVADAALRLRVGRAARESCERFYNVPRQLTEILSVIDRETG